ncbi:hypothetical protein GGF31_005742 [Allomyces arbusculus]|nr:hypothetical protein GGF31_005742 [Allomyces arbusculus]
MVPPPPPPPSHLDYLVRTPSPLMVMNPLGGPSAYRAPTMASGMMPLPSPSSRRPSALMIPRTPSRGSARSPTRRSSICTSPTRTTSPAPLAAKDAGAASSPTTSNGYLGRSASVLLRACEVVVTGDSGCEYRVDMKTRCETASSILFRATPLDASVSTGKVLLKTPRAAAATLLDTLPEAAPLRRLLTCESKAALAPAWQQCGSSVASSAYGDEEDDIAAATASSLAEHIVHAGLREYHRDHESLDLLDTVVLSCDTLANGATLVLPLARPLQPDTRVPRLPLWSLSAFALDVAQGLMAVHSAGYVHGDVSVANMVVRDPMASTTSSAASLTSVEMASSPPASHDSLSARPPSHDSDVARLRSSRPRYCLIDFGLCRSVTDAVESPSAGGTPGYVAPEVMNQLRQQRRARTHSGGHSDDHVSPSSGMPSPDLRPWDAIGFRPHHRYPTRLGSSPPAAVAGDSLASSPASDHSYMSSVSAASGASTTTRHAARAAHRARRHACARDVYSYGVSLGLLLSPYLPLTDADHLGAPRTTPEYVRTHIVPRLRVMRQILGEAIYVFAVQDHRAAAAADMLAQSVDLVLKCLAHSVRGRISARRATMHRFCTGANVDQSAAVWDINPDIWPSSPLYTHVRSRMEARRDEWTAVSSWDLDAADAADEASEADAAAGSDDEAAAAAVGEDC